jgi:hypothetical protein
MPGEGNQEEIHVAKSVVVLEELLLLLLLVFEPHRQTK